MMVYTVMNRYETCEVSQRATNIQNLMMAYTNE